MAFPTGWPPRPASGRRSIRFYKKTGVNATANFSDNAFLFIDGAGANTYKPITDIISGDEKRTIPAQDPNSLFDAGDSPGGTGESNPIAYPFNPNLFQRGTGGSSEFALAGGIITFTADAPDRPFNRDLIGNEMVIRDATSGGNDGTFKILSSPSPESLTWANSAGASESFAAATSYRLRTVRDEVPKAMLWAQTIRITNTGGGDLEISFDGENVQGLVPAGLVSVYRNRFEAGVAVRGIGVDFIIEAW